MTIYRKIPISQCQGNWKTDSRSTSGSIRLMSCRWSSLIAHVYVWSTSVNVFVSTDYKRNGRLTEQRPTESRFSTYSRNRKWHRKWAISFGRNRNYAEIHCSLTAVTKTETGNERMPNCYPFLFRPPYIDTQHTLSKNVLCLNTSVSNLVNKTLKLLSTYY